MRENTIPTNELNLQIIYGSVSSDYVYLGVVQEQLNSETWLKIAV